MTKMKIDELDDIIKKENEIQTFCLLDIGEKFHFVEESKIFKKTSKYFAVSILERELIQVKLKTKVVKVDE